jgi:UPF0755 protein
MKKILLIVVIVVGAALLWYNHQFSTVSANKEAAAFTIPAGQGTGAIADRLAAAGYINSGLAFKIYFYLHKTSTIQAGEYIFESKTKMNDLIDRLSQGETASRELNILVREGLTVKEINEQIKKMGYLSDDSFIQEAKMQEGYLFPDTYRVYKDFTAKDLVAKMRANFERKLTPDLREAIEKSGHSLEEIVTMASLLEKEVRTEEDMKIVSGIFWDRITVGQALQSCASLAYILGVNKVQYSYADTQIDSPYNTYQHPGLPPGPISNPGLKSIKAAIYPTKTNYNYFLSRPDTGETIFSATLDEHNAAKAKYLK